MKKHLFITSLFLLAALLAFSQDQFQVLTERPNEKTFKGIISREALAADSSFKWMTTGQQGYTPNTVAVTSLTRYRDSIQLLVFMGTWCEDSHIIIPRLFSILDAAGFPSKQLTLIGTDRNKRTLSHLCEALNVNNVPTIIVYKEGKELGRVIEYGKMGIWDRELGDLINAAFAK